MTHQTRIALLEDHPIFRAGIKQTLSPACDICLEADCGADFLASVEAAHPELVLLDVILPDMSGVEVARKLREMYGTTVRILVLSIDTRKETLEQLMHIGIEGFLSKNASEEELVEAVRTLMAGKTYFTRNEELLEREVMIAARSNKHETLTDREYEIMLAFCKGLSYNEIAQQMFISPKTVDNHKQRIFAKLGIHNVVQLICYAVRNKIIVL